MKMRTVACGGGLVCVAASLALLHSAPSVGQEPAKPKAKAAATAPEKGQTGDQKAIRAAADSFVKAFNAGDAKALAAHWTADGDLVDDSGRTFQGREAIAREYTAFFGAHPGASLELDIEQIRFAGPNVAIEDGKARLQPAGGGSATLGRYTAVHLKEGGKWLMTSVREAPLAHVSSHERLKELEWMIGDWQAEAGDAKIVVHCEWTDSQHFLRRTLQTTEGKEKPRSATQLIGWDPIRGCVRSWLFDSDGGFGDEFWLRDGSRWVLEASGVHPDGSESSATNILVPVDADHFTWQSVGRSLGDASLPDTAVVKISRASSKK